MSGIASVVEIWNGRTSGESETAVRTYRRVWRVTTLDPLTESLLVRAAIPVVRFQSYAGLDGQVDVQAIAQSIEERQTEDPLTWEVSGRLLDADGPAKVEKISGAEHFENNILNYDVTYVFHFRRDGWQPMLQDAGFNYLGSDGKPHPIILPSGQNPSAPVPLNGEGQPWHLARTTLTQAMLATDVQFFVAATTGFPVNNATYTNSPVQVLIDQEVVAVGFPPVALKFPATRGQNGTTAAAHAVGAAVKMLPYYLPFTAYKVLPFAALNLP